MRVACFFFFYACEPSYCHTGFQVPRKSHWNAMLAYYWAEMEFLKLNSAELASKHKFSQDRWNDSLETLQRFQGLYDSPSRHISCGKNLKISPSPFLFLPITIQAQKFSVVSLNYAFFREKYISILEIITYLRKKKLVYLTGVAPVGWLGVGITPLSGIPASPPSSGRNFYFHREKFASVGFFDAIFNFWSNILVKNFELSTKEGKLF